MEPILETPAEQKQIYEFFLASVLLKGAISVAEVVVGIIVLFVPTALFLSVVTGIVHLIPAQPPFGFFSEHLLEEVARYTSGTALFLSIYLLSRGLVKAFLIWALLLNKLWAYPSSLIILAGFLAYQVYQIFSGHSLLVIGITVFDIIVMYFIWREWRIVRARQGLNSV
jgi:Predicted membrane protein